MTSLLQIPDCTGDELLSWHYILCMLLTVWGRMDTPIYAYVYDCLSAVDQLAK
jgi:hypothetical protein